MVPRMLAVSVLDVVEAIVFGALGFLVVAVVCVVILAFLQLILPKHDTGAEAVRRTEDEESPGAAEATDEPRAPAAGDVEAPTPLDTEDDA